MVAKGIAVSRGEVWLVNLDPTVGHEIRKVRPCVIVSPPQMHNHLQTILAAPMTTHSRPAPFRIDVSFQGTKGLILLDHLRALDKSRLVRKLGLLDAATLAQTLATLQAIFTE